VKITPWRILNTSVLLILGTYKAVSTYLGETMAPTNLDWTMGVVWALMYIHPNYIPACILLTYCINLSSYWVSIVEQVAPSIAPWFLTADFSRPVRFGALGLFAALPAGVYWAGEGIKQSASRAIVGNPSSHLRDNGFYVYPSGSLECAPRHLGWNRRILSADFLLVGGTSSMVTVWGPTTEVFQHAAVSSSLEWIVSSLRFAVAAYV
jgi:hypothetical protein